MSELDLKLSVYLHAAIYDIALVHIYLFGDKRLYLLDYIEAAITGSPLNGQA